MAIFRASEPWDWPELVMDFLLQVALIVGLAAFSVWLWPAGMFDTPVGLIKLGDWLWAAGSLWVGMLCVLVFYFVVAQPVIASLKKRDED